jgi:hypothetical protein
LEQIRGLDAWAIAIALGYCGVYSKCSILEDARKGVSVVVIAVGTRWQESAWRGVLDGAPCLFGTTCSLCTTSICPLWRELAVRLLLSSPGFPSSLWLLALARAGKVPHSCRLPSSASPRCLRRLSFVKRVSTPATNSSGLHAKASPSSSTHRA